MPSRARSLAEDLRGRSDDQLALLLRLRPGLLRPVPKSFSDLALRANSAPSVIEALDDVIYQDVEGGYPITEKWRVVSDEVVDIDGLDAAACVIVTFNVEDY